MKDSKEVIADFNSYVNMTADELEGWLKSDDSNSAGWPKDASEEGGETVGHDSGRKIVEILRSNPQKKADKYTEDQVQHMRKVVAYCKRHLAQETAGNNEKSAEDVEKTKSYASLKNWGHDFLKAQGKESSGSTSKGKKSGGSKKKQEEDKEEEVEDGEEEQADQEEEKTGKVKNGNAKDSKEEEHGGDKRKTRSGQQPQSNPNKKRETRKGAAAKKSKKDEKEEEVENNGDDKEEESGEEEENDDSKAKKSNGKSKGGKKAKNGPEPGDTVSWNWGGGKPRGKVLDVKGEETSITTKRGNQVSRKGKPEDPAVVLDTGKSKAIKSAHELN